jgi:CPA1 family monovalent cation:H+ antiporter
VAFLATFGLLISATLVAMGLNYILGMDWGTSFLFGALISATDPVAVLAIFRELKAPTKLSTIVDGESLINDGTAFIMFQFLKSLAVTGTVILNRETFFHESQYFFISLFEGIAVGMIFGWIFSQAIANSRNKGVQLTLSLIVAHATFIFADGILHVSGILATMAAGIIIGNQGRRKLNAKTQHLFSEVWEFMGFMANALIFILLGIKLGQIDFLIYWQWMLVASIITIFIARPVSVFISFLITNRFRKPQERISFKYQAISIWGGLRGALSAAVVLMIPEKTGDI